MGRLLVCVVLSLLPACTLDRGSREPAQDDSLAERELPARWRECGPWDFERLVLALSSEGVPSAETLRWSPTALADLARDLRAEGQLSVRAAVLLAHGGSPGARVLLEHLESRRPEPLREGDAAEVVAAAALGARGDRSLAQALAGLATGPRPHPDLEVRVECGASALDLGRDEVVPFLLRVLHAGTPAELEDPIDWTPSETLAWAKSRAAEALSRRAGLPCAFQPDGSYQHQIDEARRLERRLTGEPGSPIDAP